MTAQLGSRSDQISAADAALKAQEAVLAKAQWDYHKRASLLLKAAWFLTPFTGRGNGCRLAVRSSLCCPHRI